jgi:hypothetical protein
VVILRTYNNYLSANLDLTRLKDAGIHAFLQDEGTATLFVAEINGIKLVVPEREAHTASAMLGIMEDERRVP